MSGMVRVECYWVPLSVLQAMPHGGIAYYNCGPQSGASQAHKHLQVLQAGATRIHGHHQRLWDLPRKCLLFCRWCRCH